jgi:hypothetical protein
MAAPCDALAGLSAPTMVTAVMVDADPRRGSRQHARPALAPYRSRHAVLPDPDSYVK